MKRLIPLLFAFAAGHAQAEVEAHHGWARATPPGAPNGAAFMVLYNGGERAVTLEKIDTEVAATAELHNHVESGGVMRMRRVEGGIDLPAGGHVALKPGGYHVMLMGLKAPLKAGDEVMLMLHFSDGSDRQLMLPVRKDAPGGQDHGAMPPAHDETHRHEHGHHH